MAQHGYLFYSSSEFRKTRKPAPGEPAELCLKANGEPVIGESRVILVAKDSVDKVYQWFMNQPETLMRRMIAQKQPHMHRLAGRYSFFDYNNDAMQKLTEAERDSCVRIVKPGDGETRGKRRETS